MSKEIPFEQHKVEWTRAKANRFWDHISSRTRPQPYFSMMAGDAVLDIVSRHIPLEGRRALDFGCGRGYLVEKLLRRGIPAGGTDFSLKSVEATRVRTSGLREFLGATHVERLPTPIPDGSYDVAFLLETLEHLFPEDAIATGEELRRIVKVGGHLVVTVPNEEDLEASEQFCPDCGATFHAVQHLRSWNVAQVSEYFREHGFEPVWVCALTLWSGPLARVADMATTVLRRKKHNLIGIARRVS